MKFKKRFLMCLAIVGVLLVPSMAKANDAQPNHKWMRSAPNDNIVNLETAGLRTDNNLRRNQTLYWAIYGEGSNATVINTSTSPPEKFVCSVPGTCVSAPLFISAPTATICVSTDIGAAASDGDTIANMRICADSTCADSVAITGSALNGIAAGVCTEFSGSGVYDGFNVGAMWVFLDITTAPASGATTLFWIVGN
jgi:hypothetical protein